MKNPFKTDPDDALQAAKSALAQAEDKLRSLEVEREAVLSAAEDDYLAQVARIDRDMASQRANAKVHSDRIVAMERRQRDHEQVRRKQAMTDSIAEIKKRLPRRRAAADKLDQALQATATAFAELLAADEAVFSGWPDVLPPAARLVYTRAIVLDALSGRRIQRPISAGIVREMAGRLPYGFAAAIDEKNAELVAELDAIVLPALPDAEAAA